jgi:hypothetical protein
LLRQFKAVSNLPRISAETATILMPIAGIILGLLRSTTRARFG